MTLSIFGKGQILSKRSCVQVRSLSSLCLIGFTLFISACASLDFDQPRTPSYAFNDTHDSYIAKKVEPEAAAHPGQSGFKLLNDGIEALVARILLMKTASHSIDAQYYFILNDLAGNLFVRELLAAADRGVRVRVLVDDIATQGYDVGMAALESHPNFEIRVFNPFSLRTGRYLNIRDYARVNRRMHNKSLTVDNQAIIVGGRNIGDEYFSAKKESNFADMDVFGVGSVAQDGSAVFDEFWNDRHSLPASALVAPLEDPAKSLLALRQRLNSRSFDVENNQYAAAFKSSEQDVLGLGSKSLSWVPYKLISDPPSKAWDDKNSDKKLIVPISDIMFNAKSELILISPYFVPRKAGIEKFRELRERGVEVRVLTNSLSSTDVAAVHSGYAPSRKPLLDMGVRLYEVKPDAKIPGTRRSGLKSSRASLHTKGFVVDRSHVFFGSFNFDPRSVHINTEMGIFMDAPELAAGLIPDFIKTLDGGDSTYEVVLNEQRQLRWLDKRDDQLIELTKEPQTSFWDRFVAGFFRILPIRGQL